MPPVPGYNKSMQLRMSKTGLTEIEQTLTKIESDEAARGSRQRGGLFTFYYRIRHARIAARVTRIRSRSSSVRHKTFAYKSAVRSHASQAVLLHNCPGQDRVPIHSGSCARQRQKKLGFLPILPLPICAIFRLVSRCLASDVASVPYVRPMAAGKSKAARA